jgi:hypothetical protein
VVLGKLEIHLSSRENQLVWLSGRLYPTMQ